VNSIGRWWMLLALVTIGWMLLALLTLTLAGGASGEQQGLEAAERDIRDDQRKLFWRGKPMEEHQEYAQLLKDRARVELSFRAERFPDHEKAYTDAYNKRIRADIEARLGQGALEEIKFAAIAKYEARKTAGR
jgi:hypothetical protein